MNDKPILRIKDLRTYFRTMDGTAKAVDGVTLSINPGETYALVGESGCGKSVTALSILQLVAKPAGYIAGGSIRFHEKEISSLPPAAMREIRGNHISMIFQEPMTALNPVFTIGNQISEAIRLHQKLSKQAAEDRSVEMLKKVGIPDPTRCYGEYPHQMSGGMRQRVMIAMALACKPEILIADEPTTALDVTIQSQILELIREIQKELGTAVLLITHDMGVVRENADRVGVMYAGEIIEEANREDIFTSPAHPYTQLLLRAIPSRGKRDQPLDTIKGMVPKATNFPQGCRFSTRCPFVMNRCRTTEPAPCSIGPNHYAKCFLLENGSKTKHNLDTTQKTNSENLHIDRNVLCLQLHDSQTYFPIRKGLFRHIVGHVRAVDGVNLKIYKGETLALVGESGCGKTTVGKSIVRLLKPTGGSISFQDTDLTRLSNNALKPFRQKIQMIFQDPFSSLNPRLTIGESISEGMGAYSIRTSLQERKNKLHALMLRVGLDPDMEERYPHEFSGGQRQRIGLARALVLSPEFIVCDEITSALD
ncbi:MAG: dipeptide ABC transporter ATP-binding protein, partial [Kiritimatiellae bacterium]|nr:dipeptide ABC transporter ATP-binding protein [Kiritimatiellia bacterium]